MVFRSWLSLSYVRHYPQTPPQRAALQHVSVARNQVFSFQVAMRAEGDGQRVTASVEAPEGWHVRVRRVGYVPVRHHNTPVEPDILDVDGLGHIPGYVPDPLFDEDSLYLPGGETHAFWFTVNPCPAGARPSPKGSYVIQVRLDYGDGDHVMHYLSVDMRDVVTQPRRDFDIIHWFYNDALIDWYGTDQFDARYWEIVSRYMANLASHNVNTIYVPVFTPPLDGVKTPSQLLKVSRQGDGYAFDWSDVKRYVDLAKANGLTRFEWTHWFTQWGANNAIRIYEGQGKDERLLWAPETAATSDTYRGFLAQFFPELRRFLDREGLLDASFFHVSDEPHGEEHRAQYGRLRAMLRELAPWMKVMDALSEIEFGRQRITDMPAASIRTAVDFVAEGIPCWCYYCCGPRGRYLNRLLDTPLPKIAMHGFSFYRWPFQGFLHWGYNYWYKSQTRTLIDPYSVQDGLRWEQGWAYGDPFMVYPGPDGPVDSLRWEVFGESLQDYALLQTLGVSRDDPLLAPIVSFEDMPKTEAWRLATLRALFDRAEA